MPRATARVTRLNARTTSDRMIVLKGLLIVLGALALIATAVLVLAWRQQERIAYQPPAMTLPDDPRASRVAYTANDGQPLLAYLVRPPGDSASMNRLVIAFHGNADLAVRLVPWAEELAGRTGWSVLLPEYRGYGGLEGSPTYDGLQRDANAAAAYALDSLGVRPDNIALYGHSLGTAVAAELASEIGPSVVILQSPLTSARDMARVVLMWPLQTLWQLIARVHYDTESRVAELDTPVWVIHGMRDGIVPTRMGRAVHAAARNKGELVLVEGAGHNDVEDVGGAAYWGFLERSLASVSLAPAATASSAAPSPIR